MPWLMVIVEDDLADDLETLVRTGCYGSISEAVRDAIMLYLFSSNKIKIIR